MLKTNISQKGKGMALFVVLTFAVAGLAAITFLSEPFVVVAQSPGNDPYFCFNTTATINTCPTNSNIKGLNNDTKDCFKTIGETKVGTSNIQNWTKSIQNFNSLIPTDNTIALINKDKNIVRGGGPVTDMAGIWDVMQNGNMTRHDRQVVLDEVHSLLAAAKPGFTKIQQDALSTCIATEANSLGFTPNY
jgi:hypothetical protein